MPEKNQWHKIQSELQEGMRLAKCRKCGCMQETLKKLRSSLGSLRTPGAPDLLREVESWLTQVQPKEYDCLGCDHCFPAVATNILSDSFPEVAETQLLSCCLEVRDQTWPPVPGEYFVFSDDKTRPVAVSTLASPELAENLANIRPQELCIVGKTETENIGIDKVIKNTITNTTIHFLLLAGKDPKGHHSGKTLLGLSQDGVDESMRVIGSPGKHPVLRNVTAKEVEAFRKQVQVVDMIGCEDEKRIVEKIEELSQGSPSSYSCQESLDTVPTAQISTVPVIRARAPSKVEKDRAGYFVIIPQPQKGIIVVEHYCYDNKLLRSIEGNDARNIYSTIVENGWVTKFSHAAYLGKELAKAELSIQHGFKYIQDGA